MFYIKMYISILQIFIVTLMLMTIFIYMYTYLNVA